MKTKILSLLILLPILASAQVTLDWSIIYGETGIATDSSNNVYTASYDYNPAGDIYLTKRNSTGVQQWQMKYDQTDNTKWEKVTWVEVDFAGNIIVSGSLMSGYSNPVNAASIIMKFSPSGTLLWRNVYETSFDGSYTKKCIIDKANNIYVLGLGTGPNGFVTKVKKFDTNGTAQWSYFDNAGLGSALNFKFTPDSNIVIAGKSITGSLMGYGKINRNGINIWNYSGVSSLTTGDLAGDASGNTYIVHGNGNSTTIKKIGSNGALIWSANYTNITAFRIEVGTDNRPVVCGYPIPGSGGSAFLKVDTSGTQVWYNNNADSIYNFLSHAMIKMDQYNNIYLAASILTNMGMCKVNSNGTNAWAITFGTGGSQAFTIGKDYNVYVTGGATARLHQIPPVSVCAVPTNLTTTNNMSASARINWSLISGAVHYQIFYKKSTDTVWLKKKVNGTKINNLLSGLSCNTLYKWKIRTVCDTVGIDVLSAFSPIQIFQTASCLLLNDLRINETSGIENEIKVFPIPFSSSITLEFILSETQNVSIVITDVMGRIVKTIQTKNLQTGNNEITIDLSELNSGIYFTKINSSENTQTIKLLKN